MRSLVIPNSVTPIFKIRRIYAVIEVIASISESKSAQEAREKGGDNTRVLLSTSQSLSWGGILFAPSAMWTTQCVA